MMRVAVGFGFLMASAMLLADNQAAVTCGVAFHVQDHRIVDNCGRQAYFNGVNVANRLKPYYPSAIGFDKRNMKLLQHYGFNLVRLGVFWQAIEPQPGHFDNQYLAHLGRTVSQLAAYHIKVLVDFHQDAYAKPWGFGFPTWAALGHAGAVNIGFPLNFMCGTQLTGQGGKKTVVGNTVCRHWDHFWDNTPIKKGGLGVQDYYMNMLTHVVSYFNQKRYQNIVGYDLLNEPFPGSRWTDCVNLAVKSSGQMAFTIKDSKGCVTFDKTKMTSFTRRAIQAIRKAEPSALAFYEPEVFYDLGVPSHIGPLHFSNTVFNFHNYNKVDMRLPFLNIASQIKKNDSAAFMSEFGASTLNSVELNTMLNLANQFNVSPAYWAYVNNPPYYFWVPPQNNSGSVFGKMPDDPRKQALVFNMSQPLAKGNVKLSKVNILSRLYAPFVAGKKVKIKVGKHGESIVLHYVPLLHRQTKVFIPPSISMKDVKVIISNVEQKRVRFQGRYVFITVNKVKSNRTVQAVITIG